MLDFLQHHGIKGQRWGVRRTDDQLGHDHGNKKQSSGYDEDVHVKKGTKMHHISDTPNSKLDDEPLHVSYKDWDNLVYKGAYATGKLTFGGSKKIYDHTYEAAEELISPSKKKRVDNFIELFRENKQQVTRDLDAIERDNQASNISRKKSSKPFSKMSEAELRKEGYDTFVSGMESGDRYPSAKKYIEKTKGKSYNALVDDNNARVYNEVKSPLIVLDAKKSLTSDSSRKVSREEVEDARSEVEKQLKKKGKKIKY